MWSCFRLRARTPVVRALLLLLFALPALAACGSTATGAARTPAATRPAGTRTTQRLPLQVAPTPTPEPSGLLPARLIISKMGVDAAIMPVGADASGAMIAPYVKDPRDPVWSSVYWWDLGALPGQKGNAVIAGHVNRPDGSPSTFTRLNRLAPGDTLRIVTADGQSLTFVVTSTETPLIQENDPGDPAFMRVFGPSLTPNLNLVTCWGDWVGNTYNRRLVVHTSLVGPSPFATGQSDTASG